MTFLNSNFTTCISDSEEIANQQDAPCDKLVRVSVSRTGVENQVMLDREVIPFYRLVIGVRDSKCDEASSFGSHQCETSGNDILYPKDCVCEVSLRPQIFTHSY